ncbi:MAG: CBS domain-containing protein, partial [Deltaproteobacteria bacterium]|nr:CBS domain-containing protein [Deltaproteobacteria bacterium]
AMSTPVFTVDENDPINEVAAKMANTKLGSALVVDSENMVSGIFTVTDGLRALSQAWDD